MKSLIASILLLALTVFLIGGEGLNPLLLNLTNLDWRWVALLIVVIIFTNLISAYRFFLISLYYADNTISLLDATKVSLAGLFLGYWMPITIVGDGARVVWLKKNVSDNYGKAIWIVLFDRFMALGALLFFLVPFIPFYINRFHEKGLLFIGVSLLLCLSLILFWWMIHAGLLGRFSEACKNLQPWTAIMRNYRIHLAIGVSYVICCFIILLIASYALNADISMFQLFAYAPLLFLAQSIPISFGGFGSRELAFLIILGDIVGKPAAVAMALLIGFSLVLASLPGGLFIGMLGRARSDKT